MREWESAPKLWGGCGVSAPGADGCAILPLPRYLWCPTEPRGAPFNRTRIVASPNTRSAAGVAKRRAPAKAPAKNETLEWIKSIGIAIAVFVFIPTFLVQAHSIPSQSMAEAVLVGG